MGAGRRRLLDLRDWKRSTWNAPTGSSKKSTPTSPATTTNSGRSSATTAVRTPARRWTTFAVFARNTSCFCDRSRPNPSRPGTHGYYGEITLQWMENHVADHDHEHLQQERCLAGRRLARGAGAGGHNLRSVREDGRDGTSRRQLCSAERRLGHRQRSVRSMQTLAQPGVRPQAGQTRPTTAADVKIDELDNDSLIIRLHFTINHLSRWLTPVHDQSLLARVGAALHPRQRTRHPSARPGTPHFFPKMHLIANQMIPISTSCRRLSTHRSRSPSTSSEPRSA